MTYIELIKNTLASIEELKQVTSSKKKLEILKANSDNLLLRVLAQRTYSGDQYRISAPDCDCISPEEGDSEMRFVNLLDSLMTDLSGNAAAAAVEDYCSKASDAKLLLIALNHDFAAGVSKKTFSKVWPDLYSEFSVALADKWSDKYEKRINFEDDCFYASRKLDGVRCICIKKDGEVHFYARSGKEFLTLGNLKSSIENMKADNFVLDGECCIVNDNGDEDFIAVVSEIKRKNWTIANPMYKVFDCLTIDEFESQTGDVRLTDRYTREAMTEIAAGVKHTDQVPQWEITDRDKFDTCVEMAASNGWEGIMIRRNIGYEGKRTSNMLKVKKFQDAEFTVLGAENDTMRFIIDGKQKDCVALARIFIEYKGCPVSVGGGFSKEERLYYAEHHDEIIGKTVTVKYFQESKNADGSLSLRFPTVKYIYREERDI